VILAHVLEKKNYISQKYIVGNVFFNMKSNGIAFVQYYAYFVDQNYGLFKLRVCILDLSGGSTCYSTFI
jgi:hypothetical protein